MEEQIIYQFPNPQNNEWINKYNEKVKEIKNKEEENKQKLAQQTRRGDGDYTAEHIGIHHILPKSINPEYKSDKNNFLYVSFKDHMDLHYYLWKADSRYAKQLWFGCVFGIKNGLWSLPGGSVEYEQLKKDLRKRKDEENE